jgi:L-alanine-DL-glutamate epimerase-like enolase superfamily enzyme
MVDLEEKYDLDDAFRLGEQMDNGMFVWLEGPLSDALLGQYAELSRKLTTQIVPDGYSYYSPEFIRKGIEAGSWGAGRFDATRCWPAHRDSELGALAGPGGQPSSGACE